jgi:RHS repeat-associated protein
MEQSENSPQSAKLPLAAAPKVELPKGGGAIRSIGEKFGANPVTGTASMAVPIAVSPGRGGFGPQLSLSYDSGSGNGPFGFGWSLNLPQLTRKTEKGLPQYDDAGESDVFILSGAEDLVPVLNGDGRFEDRSEPGYLIHRYRPRIEGLFARIERWTRLGDADVHWRSLSRDNILTIYGKDPGSRIADPLDAKRIFTWLICETRDDKGNVVLYDYKPDDGDGIDLAAAHQRNRGTRDDPRRKVNRYLKRIRYGNQTPLLDAAGERPRFATHNQLQNAGWMFEVVFDYGEHDLAIPRTTEAAPWPARGDAFSTFRSGFEIRTSRRCRRVLMFHHFDNEPGVGNDCLVRSTDFDYRDETYSFIGSVMSCGYRRQENGYLKRSMPPVEFEYSVPVVQGEVEEVDPASLENLPAGLGGTSYQWIDLHGEGIPGVLTEQAGAWYYSRNLSPASTRGVEFAAIEQVGIKPNMRLAAGARLLDLAGDGQPDVVVLDGPTAGFHEHDDEESWEPFRTFTARLTRDTDDANVRFIDLDGDGHADVLITEDDAFIWHASLAREGFGPAQRVQQALDEEAGPRLVFSEATQSIYLADMSGDGLIDLVRIRNGEVCYWPNLGYGRFGAKVTMDQPPYFDRPDSFDHRRMRVADIDGSGASDLIYLDGEGAILYFNESGNGWSAAQRLAGFPAVSDLASIQVADLKGNGTACLVWSSPLPGDASRPMRFVDLMGGQKPHLLIRSVNNLGAETVIQYAPSTKFYLADKLAGTPWTTRLPFPVHVVERVDTCDRIGGNRFITRYAYHHGYFDGAEREFRGFGMVEQWDTDEYATLGADTQLPIATNIDASSNLPPVQTRTWFHTGVHPALLADDSILPAGLSVDEEREACRALKGSMLRKEVYALDGSDREAHPYTVSEQNFTVRMVQAKSVNRHAVFFTHSREAITYHYERNLADPRVSHALTLNVDEFGNVLESAAVGYGRRLPNSALSGADQARQAERHVTCAENAFTNAIDSPDAYRTPMPSESRSYELAGLGDLEATRLAFDTVLDAVATATVLAYEETFTPNQLQKRLIEHARTRYRPNDLGATRNDVLALLAPGELESLALPGESYQLAFTPGLVAKHFSGKVSEAMLADEGRYVHSQGDANWWLRSGRAFLSPGAADDAMTELAHARRHFFLPHRFRDPFHRDGFETESVAAYDAYDLTIRETRDALGNVATAVHDYRVLQPRLTKDANGNRAEVAFDALGLVVGTAVMGKETETKGDSLQGFVADLDEPTVLAHIADPLADPHSILQLAGTRVVYDLFAYLRSRDEVQPQPAVAYALSREMHAADLPQGELTRVQHGFSYSDGFGREIQKKARAEAGRWIGSGWTIFNNKGKPVRQYEPFFSATPVYEFARAEGVSPVLFYDPAGRVVATLHPNHTWEKVLFDPWRQESWDVNDTVAITDAKGDPDVGDFFRRLPDADYLPSWYTQRATGAMGADERAAAIKAAVHSATPSVVHLDSLGRAFMTVAHNKFKPADAADVDPPTEIFLSTRILFDSEGNQRDVIDAQNRIVMHYDYDMLGNPVHRASMEAGERWVLNDVAGATRYGWDSRDHRIRTNYDVLRRPIEIHLQTGSAPELLVGKTQYGESQPDAQANNLLGKSYRAFDGAGVVTTAEYDFKGNLQRGSRQFAVEYQDTLDWSVDVALEAELFTTASNFDALNRPLIQITPNNSAIRRTYNEARLPETIEANLRGETLNGERVWKSFVTNIDYNAKGQRERIAYQNGVSTTHGYDPLTFRLAQLRTSKGGQRLQDLLYTYDPAGNLTGIRDEAQQTIYFRNAVVEPGAEYTYDAIYQLTDANGREHIGQLSQPETNWNDEFRINLAHPNDGLAMRRYTERYEYDDVGNLLQVIHEASNGNWTRAYEYAEPSQIEGGKSSNRLSATQVGSGIPEPHGYDSHGNMNSMSHLPLMRWNYLDQLQATARQVVSEGSPETTYYVYDGGGQRVRKVTERASEQGATPTRMKQRVYLGGFEIYREYSADGSSVSLEREALHVMDGQQRIALVETRTLGDDGSAAQLIRYQLGNHLGSASLELDEAGRTISYEEYYPFGSTSFQATDKGIRAEAKRYRYTGKERDDESGLYYLGARYLTTWLGRWCSIDPAFDSGSRYRFANNSPVTVTDPDGRAPVAVPYNERALQLVVEQYARELGLPTAHEMCVQPHAGGPGLRPDTTVMTGWRSTYSTGVGGQSVESRGFIANEWKMPDGGFTDNQLHHDVPNQPTLDVGINSPKHAPEIGRAPGDNIKVTYRVTRFGPPADPLSPAYDVIEEQAITRGSTNPLLVREMEYQARTSSPAPAMDHSLTLGRGALAPPPAEASVPVPEVVAAPEVPPAVNATLVPSAAEASTAPSMSARALSGAAAAAKLVGRVLTVVGASNEADLTVEFERQNGRGELNAYIGGGATFVAGMFAGAVDDVFAVEETAVMGAPMQTMASWDEHGSGVIQHGTGEAIRAFLGFGFSLGL